MVERRDLMRATVAGVAAPFVGSLGAIGEAAAQTAGDYKALVCVFLYGGNDYANTLPPYDAASYAQYAAARQNIALNRDALAATLLNPSVALAGGRQYALAPNLSALRQAGPGAQPRHAGPADHQGAIPAAVCPAAAQAVQPQRPAELFPGVQPGGRHVRLGRAERRRVLER